MRRMVLLELRIWGVNVDETREAMGEANSIRKILRFHIQHYASINFPLFH